jgi:hypothetical protein
MMDNLYIFPGSSEGEVPHFDLGGEPQRRIMLVLSQICRCFVPVDWIVGPPKMSEIIREHQATVRGGR